MLVNVSAPEYGQFVKENKEDSFYCDMPSSKIESNKCQVDDKTGNESKYMNKRSLRKSKSRGQMKKTPDSPISSVSDEQMGHMSDPVSDDDQALITYVKRPKMMSDSPISTNSSKTVESNTETVAKQGSKGSLIQPTRHKIQKFSHQKKLTHHKQKKSMNKKQMKKKAIANKNAKFKAVVDNKLKNLRIDEVDGSDFSENKCPICSEVFTDAHSFTLHIREHNTNKKSHVCQICSKELSSASSLDRHMYVHSKERPYKCTICGLAFTTNGNMNRHMRTHLVDILQGDGSKDEALKSRKERMRERLRRRQKKKKPSASLSSSPDHYSFTDYESGSKSPPLCNVSTYENLTCPVCGKRFLDHSSKQSHMLNHPCDPIKCSRCNQVTENYVSYLSHDCRETEVKVEKPIIGFRDLAYSEFSSKKFSLIARNACEGDTRNPINSNLAFECRSCGTAFPCNRTLRSHELTHASEIGTYCYTCKCGFASSELFREHQLKHRPPQLCALDHKAVDSKEDFLALLELKNKVIPTDSESEINNLDNAMNLKTMEIMGQTKYEMIPKHSSQSETSNDFADVISIVSLTSNTVIPNIRASPLTAAPASPPRDTSISMPSSPIIEGSANSNMEVLQCSDSQVLEPEGDNHSKSDASSSDEGHSCNECEARFTNTTALKRHRRTHVAGGQFYKCKTCPYQSVDRSTLHRHLRTHSGERPFKCNICGFAFTTKANSHRHVKKRHRIPENRVSAAVVYNPNMLENSDNIPSDINSTETICKYCNEDFFYNRVLRHHLRSLNNSCSRKPFACKKCKLGFSTKNNCARHISNQHPEFKDQLKELIVVNAGVPQNSNESENQKDTSDESPEKVEKMDTSDDDEPLNLKLKRFNSSIAVQEQAKSCAEDEERVSAAQSLVSLSEHVPPQENPLDLSLHALDLSSKPNSSMDSPRVISPMIVEDQSQAPEIIQPVQLAFELSLLPPARHMMPAVIPFPNNSLPTDVINISPAGLSNVKNGCEVPTIKFNDGQFKLHATLPLSYITKAANPVKAILPKSTPLNLFICSTVNPVHMPLEKVESGVTDKKGNKPLPNSGSYQCNYCSATFTLKSNKERHTKKKHPEHARPTRSRNYDPSTTEALKRTSPLSDNTRKMLRSVLSTKANVGGEKADSAVNRDNLELKIESKVVDLSPEIKLECVSQSETLKKRHATPELDHKSDSDNTDLASVSSVINTANTQVFKKFLNEAKEDEPIEDLKVAKWESSTDLKGDVTSTDSKVIKKSSYSRSKNFLRCGFCKRRFPWVSALKRHLLTHTGRKPHKCPKCPVRFTTKSNRHRHICRLHSDTVNKCSSCYSTFSSRQALNQHYKSKHMPKTAPSVSKVEPVQPPLSSIESVDIKLDIKACDNTTVDLNGCKNENDVSDEDLEGTGVLVISEDIPEENSLITKNDEILESSITQVNVTKNAKDYFGGNQKNNEFTCCFCLKTFTSVNSLDEHVKSHVSEPAINCKCCNESFTDNAKLLSHQAYHQASFENNNDATTKNVETIKTIPNSLLYLIAAVEKLPPPTNGSISNDFSVSKDRTKLLDDNESNGDSNLIMNLLGIEDPQLIEDMIDNAARNRIQNSSME